MSDSEEELRSRLEELDRESEQLYAELGTSAEAEAEAHWYREFRDKWAPVSPDEGDSQ